MSTLYNRRRGGPANGKRFARGKHLVAKVTEGMARGNQCDGCARGLPVTDGVHHGPTTWDAIACTAHVYTCATRAGKSLAVLAEVLP